MTASAAVVASGTRLSEGFDDEIVMAVAKVVGRQPPFEEQAGEVVARNFTTLDGMVGINCSLLGRPVSTHLQVVTHFGRSSHSHGP